VNDALLRSTGKALADAVSVAEVVLRAIGKTCADALMLGESFLIRTLGRLGQYGQHFAAELWARLWIAVSNLRLFAASPSARSRAASSATRLFAADVNARLWSATETMITADPKDPEAIEDFQIDWSGALGTDTITASAWEVPSDLTIVAQSTSTTLATVRLSGGTAGQNYSVKNIVTLASGRVLTQPLMIPVVV
jgi:hypothetical protein